jgi:hypothetical protein
MWLAGKQFWLGPARAGQTVRFWVSVDLIHLFIGSTRIKTVRSHLSVTDLARLAAQGAINAGPSPLPPVQPGDPVEVERVVSKDGNINLAGQVLLAAEILGGRRVGIRIEPDLLMIYGPPPRPSLEPVRVQRRASSTGVITLCRQKIALGRTHRHQTLTVHVPDTTLAIEVDDETLMVRRTTTLPIRNIKPTGPDWLHPQLSRTAQFVPPMGCPWGSTA